MIIIIIMNFKLKPNNRWKDLRCYFHQHGDLKGYVLIHDQYNKNTNNSMHSLTQACLSYCVKAQNIFQAHIHFR